ncbi:hypothetical protein AVEN_143971-1 [Araneus ventricosus]|uniref:Uncharacterized protein n=1 Tax=Araneus ventricosus TaxID=182803 RepID=A0A4Y2HK96_ARAVE|nr:hypothetical protein AVEN_143971-1 [Araneus ventricosus]
MFLRTSLSTLGTAVLELKDDFLGSVLEYQRTWCLTNTQLCWGNNLGNKILLDCSSGILVRPALRQWFLKRVLLPMGRPLLRNISKGFAGTGCLLGLPIPYRVFTGCDSGL